MPWGAASAAGGTWGAGSAAAAPAYGALSIPESLAIGLPADFPIIWGVQQWFTIAAASGTWTAKGTP